MYPIVPPFLSYGPPPFPTDRNFVIQVPSESIDAYKAATNWSNYASKIEAMP